MGLVLHKTSPDVIIPLAALVGAPLCSRYVEEAVAVNRDAVTWLAQCAQPDQLIIYPNSNSAYGVMPDDNNVPLDEDAPQCPLSVYAETKCAAEVAVLRHPNSVVFRLATVFGASPRMRTDLLVNNFVLRAVQDRSLVLFEPNARRNYVHVRDVVEAFLWTIAAKTNEPEPLQPIYGNWWSHGITDNNLIFNLGLDAANCTKRELCEVIKTRVPGFTYHVAEIGEDPDKRDYLVSSARLKHAGYEARRTLEEGIDELVKLYRGFPQHSWGNV